MRRPFGNPLAVVVPLVALSGCAIPGLDLFGGGDDAECRFRRDCDEGFDCDDGVCVPDDDGPGGEGEGEGDPPPDPEGPQYLQFSTNVTTVHNTDTVIFTAVLTDPDGIDDIIGGSLVNPDNDATAPASSTRPWTRTASASAATRAPI